MMPDAPRPGPSGPARPWDRMTGSGADRSATIAIIAATVFAILLAIGAAIGAEVSWRWWQWLLVLALSADLGSGLVANALTTTKRWYHRPHVAEWRRIAFTGLHLHLPLLALAIPDAIGMLAAWLGYLWLVGGATALLAVPDRLRLGVAICLTLLGTVLLARLIPLTGAIGWMPLALMLKLLVGHMVGPEQR